MRGRGVNKRPVEDGRGGGGGKGKKRERERNGGKVFLFVSIFKLLSMKFETEGSSKSVIIDQRAPVSFVIPTVN